MKKLPTLLPKNPNDLGLVTPGALLFPIEELTAYLKIDGTACAIIEGKPYFRYDARLKSKGKDIPLQVAINNLPKGAIACQNADPITGHWPHWIPAQKGNRLHQELVDVWTPELEEGTYEGIGPVIGANPPNEDKHLWVKHNDRRLIYTFSKSELTLLQEDPYTYFKTLFYNFKFEGLVFYKHGEPVAKLRRSDFGYGKYQNVSNYLMSN